MPLRAALSGRSGELFDLRGDTVEVIDRGGFGCDAHGVVFFEFAVCVGFCQLMGDRSGVGEDLVIGKAGRGPLAETGALGGTDTVAYREDDVEAVVFERSLHCPCSFGANL